MNARLAAIVAETQALRAAFITICSPGARRLAKQFSYKPGSVVTVPVEELLRNLRKTMNDLRLTYEPKPGYKWSGNPFPHTKQDIDEAITILRSTLDVKVVIPEPPDEGRL